MIEIPEYIWKNSNHIGVYLMYSDEGIVYIGKSVNVYARFAAHHFDNSSSVCLEEVKTIKYIPIGCDDKAKSLELALIKHLKPEWNKTLANIDISYSEYLLLVKYDFFNTKRIERKNKLSIPLSKFKSQCKKGDIFVLSDDYQDIKYITKLIDRKCSEIINNSPGWSLHISDEKEKKQVIKITNNYLII